jgi:uncharacterized repeat protein (TIGR04138 family)
MPTQQALDLIRTEIITAGRDTRYSLQSYAFVLAGLDYCKTRAGSLRHFTGKEVSNALAEFAAKQFGPMALSVLTNWGITTTDDFGYIVYNLIDIRIIKRQKSDSVKDFFNVLDLKSYYANQKNYPIDTDYIKSIKGS